MKQKQEMRQRFHPQLARLWKMSRHLEDRIEYDSAGARVPYKEALGDRFRIGNYRLCPIVTKALSLHCSLHILFLRADEPGAAIQSGDIDNRLKTLIDALTMPADARHFGGYETPSPDEDPFYCLLEDDRLVSNFSVETDTLLQPTAEKYDVNDARVVITVTIWPYKVGMGNLDFI